MNGFVFTENAKRKFDQAPKEVQERMGQKFKELKNHPDIFVLLKKLHDWGPGTHRLRVGTYRLILELRSQNSDQVLFWVLDIGDRKEIYR